MSLEQIYETFGITPPELKRRYKKYWPELRITPVIKELVLTEDQQILSKIFEICFYKHMTKAKDNPPDIFNITDYINTFREEIANGNINI